MFSSGKRSVTHDGCWADRRTKITDNLSIAGLPPL